MTDDMWIILAVFDTLGLLVGAGLIWRFGGGWRRDARVFLWFGTGMLFAAIAVAFGLTVSSGFAAMRLLVHAVGCVCAPLALARGVWHLRRGARPFGVLLLLVGVVTDGVYYYARRIEPFWLEVSRYELVSPRLAASASIKVVVLADLQTDHIGDYERDVFARMDAERADLILLPGDYLQLLFGSLEELEAERLALAALFNELTHEPRYGIWGVDGDVDSAHTTFAGSVARPLKNETVVLDGDPALQLIGLGRHESRSPISESQRASVREFAGLTIVMGHAPDFVNRSLRAFDAVGEKASLPPMFVVAGHTHGGQVVVPFFGPPITLSGVPRKYASGFHQLGEMAYFVSRGVGLERGYAPRVRFNCRPELAVFTLRGAK